ncbi:MAG: DUF6560 family protein [Lachnospiraceae bacterium]
MWDELMPIIVGIVVAVCLAAFRKSADEVDKNTNGVFVMPRILGFLGVIAFVLFGAFTGVYVWASDEVEVPLVLLFAAFSLVGVWLAMYGFNRRLEITDTEVRFRNIFCHVDTYRLTDITMIKQKYFGDYVCYVNGKKAFLIDQQFPTARDMIHDGAAALGNDFPMITKLSKQKQLVEDGMIISRTSTRGYVEAWFCFLFPIVFTIIISMAPDTGTLLASAVLLVWGTGYLFCAYRYLVTYNTRSRKLTVRRCFTTKEYFVDEYDRKIGVETENGMRKAIVFYKDNKRKFKIKITNAVTSSELLLEVFGK